MGLLTQGTPMTWDEIKPLTDYIRKHGIIQLIHLWNRLKDRQHDVLLWGDEVSGCPTCEC